MPRFETTQDFALPPGAVFDFFARPANVVLVAPPEFRLQLEDAPERLTAGARVAVRVRRWGLSRRIVSEVTTFQEGALLVEEQREGPFLRWVHTRRFEAREGGTRLTEAIEYEPPGGMLGLLLTAQAVEADLTRAFAWREGNVVELLTPAPTPPCGPG